MSNQKSEIPDLKNRREFLKIAGGTAAALLLSACASREEATVSSEVGQLSPAATETSSSIANPADTTSTIAELESSPSTTEMVDTTTETTQPASESLIGPEELVDGAKLWDMVITQPGESSPMVNLPAFASLLDPASGNDILDNRGVLIEVAKNSVNPDKLGSSLWAGEQALPGEEGAVQVFAHRVTEISPDRDGDGRSDGSQKEPMFRDLDHILPGAELTLYLANGKVVRYRALESTDGIHGEGVIAGGEFAYKVVLNVESANKLTNPTNTQKYRNQATGGRKLFRTVACHPKNSARDRIVVEWEQIEE
jgi:hypothetical protein